MPSYSLDAQVSYQPEMAIVRMEGEINSFGEDVLNRAYAQVEEGNTDYVLLNFNKVGYMNSTGIALIVALLSRARRANKKVLACGLSSHFLEIFQITRLSDFIKIYPDEASVFSDRSLTTRIS